MSKYEFKGSKAPWNLSPAILRVYSETEESQEICNVTCGNWGDTYPVLKCVHDLAGEYKAEMEMIVYGHTPNEYAESNAKLITAAPDLLEACIAFIEKVEAGKAKSTESYNQMKTAVEKALGLNKQEE